MGTNPCTVADCSRTAMAKGICRLHYDRQRRGSEHATTPGLLKFAPTVKLTVRIPKAVCKRLQAEARKTRTPLAKLLAARLSQ